MPTINDLALGMLRDGMTIGLGTGRAASSFIEHLGVRVRGGLKIKGVSTSEYSAELAKNEGIPVASLDEVALLDIAFDGADEVDPRLNLIKGFGGALVREKIVAASAQKFVVLVGKDKLVPKLGQRGRLPVEIVSFGLGPCRRRLEGMGFQVEPRQKDGRFILSDNGNTILDCHREKWDGIEELERTIKLIPGVVDTGLFLGMADIVLVQDGEQTIEKSRKNPVGVISAVP